MIPLDGCLAPLLGRIPSIVVMICLSSLHQVAACSKSKLCPTDPHQLLILSFDVLIQCILKKAMFIYFHLSIYLSIYLSMEKIHKSQISWATPQHFGISPQPLQHQTAPQCHLAPVQRRPGAGRDLVQQRQGRFQGGVTCQAARFPVRHGESPIADCSWMVFGRENPIMSMSSWVYPILWLNIQRLITQTTVV